MWTTTGLLQTTCGINSSLVLFALCCNNNQLRKPSSNSLKHRCRHSISSAASAGYKHATARSRENSNETGYTRTQKRKEEMKTIRINLFSLRQILLLLQLLWLYFWTGIIKRLIKWCIVFLLATCSKCCCTQQAVLSQHTNVASSAFATRVCFKQCTLKYGNVANRNKAKNTKNQCFLLLFLSNLT